MAVIDQVVGLATDLLILLVAETLHRGSVRAQAVGGDGLWRTVTLQRFLHERQRCALVARFRHVS